jgi:hypothetical protein
LTWPSETDYDAKKFSDLPNPSFCITFAAWQVGLGVKNAGALD